jgi:hypothetical protein
MRQSSVHTYHSADVCTENYTHMHLIRMFCGDTAVYTTRISVKQRFSAILTPQNLCLDAQKMQERAVVYV